ncbi:KTSC domain-containing protein [Microbacterium sp.]|uniref:KTSC domain-containing protein n=1 Tax=Microbacterium sp. TaxID=51671 RepID=UPI0028121834|nr:KTSC domain-containing protein [Microbacterium sp.]
MRREPVESSAIASIGYAPEMAVLEIEFVGGGQYRYFAVPPSIHRALMDADSVGQAFITLIRDRYPTERIE